MSARASQFFFGQCATLAHPVLPARVGLPSDHVVLVEVSDKPAARENREAIAEAMVQLITSAFPTPDAFKGSIGAPCGAASVE